MRNIFKPRTPPPIDPAQFDRVHYACGKNVMDGWLNVDGFDVSYPDGAIDAAKAERIFHCDLSQAHPFADQQFRFGYAEDFLEHLTQADSIVFLKEAWRCFRDGGILRLSFPGWVGIMRHFQGATREDILRGVKEAYTMWHHEHFYCAESLQIVAKALGWRTLEVCPFGTSRHPVLHNLETRPDQRDLNLVVELTK